MPDKTLSRTTPNVLADTVVRRPRISTRPELTAEGRVYELTVELLQAKLAVAAPLLHKAYLAWLAEMEKGEFDFAEGSAFEDMSMRRAAMCGLKSQLRYAEDECTYHIRSY